MNLLFRQPFMQESVRVGCVALPLSSGCVEVLIARLPYTLRTQVRHRHLVGCNRVPTAISRMTGGALLQIQPLSILRGTHSGECHTEGRSDNDSYRLHRLNHTDLPLTSPKYTCCAMPTDPPRRIAIDHDDYYANRVGRTKDGFQVFVTTPFIPALGDEIGREFLAVYVFERDGKLKEARIDDLGPRSELEHDRARRLLEERTAELGPIDYGRIVVQPFAIERFGTSFGLVPRASGDEEDGWWVEVQPGNYMAFHEPWDSGEYDT